MSGHWIESMLPPIVGRDGGQTLFGEQARRDERELRRLVVRTAANHWDPRYTHVGMTTVGAPHLLRGLDGEGFREGPAAWGRGGGSSQPAEVAEIYRRCERVCERFNRMMARREVTA